jgi:prolyl-tRNA synthetase
VVKAIELGHIFKLGTKYSEALGANFLDKDGKEKPIIMGSYGIGAERIIACFIEQNFDDKGIVWKRALTPYHVHIIPLNFLKFENVRETAEKLNEELEQAGFDVLLDDRDESPGIKFNDADLIGLPIQIVVGKKNVENGNVELKYRATDQRDIVSINDVLSIVKDYYNA